MNERNAVRVSNDISLKCKPFFFPSPSGVFISWVHPKDIQIFLWLLWVSAQEIVPVLMQIVHQIAIKAVFSDDVNRT